MSSAIAAAAVTLDLSEQLLRVLASVLDIRQVFPQVSAIANQVLPHDRMTMSLHDGDQTCITHAASNDDGPMVVRITGPCDRAWFGRHRKSCWTFFSPHGHDVCAQTS